MKIAIIGVTGLVGRVMLKVLEESLLLHGVELIPVASARSKGKTIKFMGEELPVMEMADGLRANPNIAIFSAGAETSKNWAPKFAGNNVYVIDNYSAWRMEKNVPLVVPEINADTITKTTHIIANPNCSTIQMVLALFAVHRQYGVRRVIVSTYQSVTGSGARAVRQMENERAGIEGERFYPHPIDLNLLPHGGYFLENGYTSEEQKLVDESRKILGDQELKITATVVRVPVYGGHSEAVNVELKNPFELDDIRRMIAQTPGIALQDDPIANLYPMPILSEGRNEVFVGRLRRDLSCDNAFNMWVVSDNLRKGAATNAIQIAEYLVTKKLI
ncbi:MAG TPA: aspartate-semialdehyde dehydrogenase [Bacteroidales bacterium]|nr:aspartate-semialdehyde dehydrogenase [Bacteroidales bacterium]